jgi:hypothetical protein
MVKYPIIDNGGVIFIVEVNNKGKKAVVFNTSWNKIKKKVIPNTQLLIIPYKKIFIGSSPKKFSYDKKHVFSYRGNSILLQIESNKYIFIGREIISFSLVPDDSIVKYISFMGNNGVSYPYAIGLKYTYLPDDRVYINNKVLNLKDEITAQYYGFDVDKKHHKEILKNTHKLLKQKIIIKRQ